MRDNGSDGNPTAPDLSEVSPLLPNATKIPDSHRLSIYLANPQDDVSSTRWTAITTAS